MRHFDKLTSAFVTGHSKGKLMSLRPAFLTVVLGSTALIPAVAHAQSVPVGSSDVSLTQEAAVASRSTQKLNVGLAQGGFAAVANQPLTFKTYWNYDSLIYIGEVRVFDKDDTSLSNPLKTIRVERDAPTVWTPTGRVGQEYLYVLRVYNLSLIHI